VQEKTQAAREQIGKAPCATADIEQDTLIDDLPEPADTHQIVEQTDDQTGEPQTEEVSIDAFC
jgi:hypothetical protein